MTRRRAPTPTLDVDLYEGGLGGVRPWRLALVVGAFVVAFLGEAWQAAREQLGSVDLYQRAVVSQLVSEGEVKPFRGEIVDRDFETLATSIEIESAIAEPFQITDKEKFSDVVGPLLGLEPEVVYEKVRGDGQYALLKKGLSQAEAEGVRRVMPSLPGLLLDPKLEMARFYPHTSLAGHVVGFVNGEQRGVNGVEACFDKELRGEGRSYYRARGRGAIEGRILAEDLGSLVPEAASVVLTIDREIQEVAEHVLAEEVLVTRAEGGMVLVTEVASGEIVAMANYPFVNPNSYTEHEPWVWKNRILTDVIEPGSTFKPITYAIALEEQATWPEERFEIPYSLAIGKHRIKDVHHESPQSAAEVVANSSNIGTALIALRLDKEIFHRYLKAFGFGARTGVGLAGEEVGLLPDASKRSWGRFKQASVAFGQGLGVTLVQLHMALASLANGGVLMKPLLVKEVRDASGRVVRSEAPTPVRRVVSEKAAALAMDAMELVVSKGTGGQAHLDFYRVFGKTGTAQIAWKGRYLKDRWNALFFGAFPRWAPRYAITVLIEKPVLRTYGGDVAAPAFRRIAQGLIEERKFYPVDVVGARERLANLVQAAGTSEGAGRRLVTPPAGAGLVPDFRGLNLRESLLLASRMGVRLEPVGEGIAVAQSTDPYTEVAELESVTVEYERAF